MTSNNVNTFHRRPHLTKEERLPKCFKDVGKVLKAVKSCQGNIKTVMLNLKTSPRIFNAVYQISYSILENRRAIDHIIQKLNLLEKEPALKDEIASILIYKLVFKQDPLQYQAKPAITIKKYENDIQNEYQNWLKTSVHTELLKIPKYVRVNSLAITVDDVLKNLRKSNYYEIRYSDTTSLEDYLQLVKSLEPNTFLIDYHFKDILVFPHSEALSQWKMYQMGYVFIQDKSSYIPVHVLDPQQGSTVIDTCAAPGMKTLHIISRMQNMGKVFAYERNNERFLTLKSFLSSSNIEICEAECIDFLQVDRNDSKFQDLEYILVDPSCSGSGMVKRMDSVTDMEDSKSEERLKKLSGFQIVILKHALSFPAVKRLVYSTCSINEEENEFVVHEALNAFHGIFKLVNIMPEWPIRGRDTYEYGTLCLRAVPEESLTNGFFVAMFERIDPAEMHFDTNKKRNRKSKRGSVDNSKHSSNNPEDEWCNMGKKPKLEPEGDLTTLKCHDDECSNMSKNQKKKFKKWKNMQLKKEKMCESEVDLKTTSMCSVENPEDELHDQSKEQKIEPEVGLKVKRHSKKKKD